MKKILALVLALMMVLSMTFAVAEEAEEFDAEAYGTKSSELYTQILGEFYDAYTVARAEVTNISLRHAQMAIAEAKLLSAAVYQPGTSKGGNYAISRIAPRTINSTLWGNDSDRYHQALIVNEDPLTLAEMDEMKAKWAELKGTGTYEAWAKEYLLGKGYTLNTDYSLNYTADPETWDGLATSKAADSEAIVNTYDGLMEYDIENVQQPALATGYTVSEDGLTYTFTIREGVKWVDSQGREVAEVTADDFVAGMNHMLDALGGLEYLVGTDGGCGIVNAQQYIDGEISDFSQVGVKAVDKYTLQYTLEAPAHYFVTMLGYNCFAPMNRDYFLSQGGGFGEDYAPDAETYLYGKDPDHIAYCGPYLVTNLTPENTIVFSANESYWNKDAINLKTITWKFNDSSDALKAYNDMKAGALAGTGLNSSALEVAKQDGWFEKYAYVSGTDATAYGTFLNIDRGAFANVNDQVSVASPQTAEDQARTAAAVKNVHFRRALFMASDRAANNAQKVGEELKLASIINSYTPGNFVALTEDVTVDINGTATTFAAGTYYGAIMQAQLDADQVAIKVWDPTAEAGAGASFGFDGWYNPEAAAAEFAIAKEELAAQGIVIDAENPIYVDLPAYTASTTYNNAAEATKKSVETNLPGVIVNKTECTTLAEWYYAGYYTNFGYEANYDLYDLSGWGPDYGDPQSYLDTLLPDYAGYMTKCIGIF